MPLEKVTTEWNAAAESSKRLQEKIAECNEFSIMAKTEGYNVKILRLWRDTLKVVYREIRPKLKKKEIIRLSKLNQLSLKISPIIVEKNTEEGKTYQVNPIAFNKHYFILSKMDEILRIYADSKGMLMPNKRSSDNAISEMD